MKIPGLSGDLWPVHPQPQDDQLLTSWIQQTAFANGMKVQSFCNLTLGRRAEVWTRDFDRSAKPETLAKLSEATGIPEDKLESLTLRGYAGTFVGHIHQNGHSRWILPAGVYHRTRRRYGMQYCPQCLHFDERPYYRRAWRLAFMAECPVHQCLLRDRCPTCEAPINFHRVELGRRSLRWAVNPCACAQCGFDLRNSGCTHYNWTSWEAGVAYRSLALFHWIPTNVMNVPFAKTNEDACTLLHGLSNVLISRRRRIRDLGEVMSERFKQLQVARAQRVKDMEQLGPVDRLSVIEAALYLLAGTPPRLIGTLKEANLTAGRLKYARQQDEEWMRLVDVAMASGNC